MSTLARDYQRVLYVPFKLVKRSGFPSYSVDIRMCAYIDIDVYRCVLVLNFISTNAKWILSLQHRAHTGANATYIPETL